MSSDYQKKAKALMAKARKEGWEVTVDGRTHFRITSPDGTRRVTLCNSSNAPRAWANVMSQLRRAGFPTITK